MSPFITLLMFPLPRKSVTLLCLTFIHPLRHPYATSLGEAFSSEKPSYVACMCSHRPFITATPVPVTLLCQRPSPLLDPNMHLAYCVSCSHSYAYVFFMSMCLSLVCNLFRNTYQEHRGWKKLSSFSTTELEGQWGNKLCFFPLNSSQFI